MSRVRFAARDRTQISCQGPSGNAVTARSLGPRTGPPFTARRPTERALHVRAGDGAIMRGRSFGGAVNARVAAAFAVVPSRRVPSDSGVASEACGGTSCTETGTRRRGGGSRRIIFGTKLNHPPFSGCFCARSVGGGGGEREKRHAFFSGLVFIFNIFKRP